MTLSIAELLFEDATLKNNQPLPETASEDFTVNQAFLNSLKKTVSGKIFSKLPDAKLVKKAIDEIKSVDSQEEKDKIQKQVESIINDPLGAFSKQDLMRIAISATNVSRLGPVVFDVAQMKTGKEQVKGFTGIDLQLIKSTQIIPFLVMTKEGEVLSGENNRKGSFGYAFLAPAYYAKIEEKNIPVYEELFPGLLENHIINGEESKFAANVENLELPVVPIDSEILKFVQQAFKNQKTLPALVQKLQTTYRSTMQNIVRDEEEKGDSPAERQSQEELNAGLFENNSLVYKQGIKYLLAENTDSNDLNKIYNEIINDYAVNGRVHYSRRKDYRELIATLLKTTGYSYMNDTFQYHYRWLESYNFISQYEEDLNVGKIGNVNLYQKEKLKIADCTNTISKRAKGLINLQNHQLVNKTIEAFVTKERGGETSFLSISSRPRILASDNIKYFLKKSFNDEKIIECFAHWLVGQISSAGKKLEQLKIIEAKEFGGNAKDLGLMLSHVVSVHFYKNKENKASEKLAKYLRILLFFGFYEDKKVAGYYNFLSELEAKSKDDTQDDVESAEDSQDAQKSTPEEQQAAQPEPESKPPSPTDFKGKLENAARELERMLSLIVNRQEQSEESNIVLARSLYSGLTKTTTDKIAGDAGGGDTLSELLRLTYGTKNVTEVYKSVYDKFHEVLEREKESLNAILSYTEGDLDSSELGIKFGSESNPVGGEKLYFDLYNNKIPEELEKLISGGAKEISQKGGDDASSYTENLETFKKRVSETCQKFSNVLKTVTIGSSSTQRSVVLKNKPILNFVARKIREENKSYEEFFKTLFAGRNPKEYINLLKHFSFSPMFDFDGKLINNLFKGIERNISPKNLISILDDLSNNEIDEKSEETERILLEVLGSLFKDDKLKVQEIISGSQEYKDQCELFYGVEPSEEEAKDSQLEELCKSISRKLLEAEDEKAYNEKRREAQEKYEKEMLDAKKEQVREEGFRFGVGAAIPLAVSVLGAVATGGLGALALATAGVLGMPVGALIGHSTVGLKPVEKDEVKKADLTKDIEDLAKENLKGLDASIIEALKNATILEGIYVHERSLAELLFELKDVDIIGKKSRKKEIKKREIKRKDFEDILTRNKVLMYDSKYASSPADISAVKNEFIESLNLLLSYYYNATIENVKQATSSDEVKTNFIRTAVSNKLEAAKDTLGDNADQQFVEEFRQTTEEFDIPLDDDEFKFGSISDLDVENLNFNFSSADFQFDSDHVESESAGEKPGTEDLSPGIFDESEPQTKSGDSETSSSDYMDKLSVDLSDFNKFKNSENVYKNLYIDNEEDFKQNLLYCFDALDKALCPVVSSIQNEIYIVGFVYKGTFRFVHPSHHEDLFDNKYNVSDIDADLIRAGFDYKFFIDLQKNTQNPFFIVIPNINAIKEYNQEVASLLQNFLNRQNSPEKSELFKGLINNKGKLTLENKSNKSSSDYILGSLTNLLFESNNKEDLNVVKRVYNKKDSVNSSSLEKEWRRLWNIYK